MLYPVGSLSGLSQLQRWCSIFYQPLKSCSPASLQSSLSIWTLCLRKWSNVLHACSNAHVWLCMLGQLPCGPGQRCPKPPWIGSHLHLWLFHSHWSECPSDLDMDKGSTTTILYRLIANSSQTSQDGSGFQSARRTKPYSSRKFCFVAHLANLEANLVNCSSNLSF